MEAFFSAVGSGWLHLFAWPTIGYLFTGMAMGFALGIIPGLSAVTGMALLLPFVFDKSPYDAMALLIGMYAVTTLVDNIPAVLIGVPGTAAAQAQVIDGYPMGKKGEAARALGASYTCDIVCTIFGVGVFALLFPVLQSIITLFASPEYVMLGLLALSLVGYVGGGAAPLRGLIVAGLGLLISMIGMAPVAAIPRFTFGLLYLWDLPMVPLVLGLFGIPELIDLIVRRQAISTVPERTGIGMWQGVRDVFREKYLVLYTSVLGAIVGMIPAMGGTVAEWWGYGAAVQMAKDKSMFGKGDVRGVIGPEAAVAAQKPTALIPTITFGIPGNVAMALLLGAFIILGMKPGADMLTKHLDVTMLIMWSMVIANIIGAAIAIAMANRLARLTLVRSSVLAPIVLGFMAIGAVGGSGSIENLITMVAAGLLGYLMERTGWPRAPMVLGLVLGPIIETYLFISYRAYGWAWVGRPMVIILFVILVLTFVAPRLVSAVISRRRQSRVRATANAS